MAGKKKIRDSKECKVLKHAFGVVRLYSLIAVHSLFQDVNNMKSDSPECGMIIKFQRMAKDPPGQAEVERYFASVEMLTSIFWKGQAGSPANHMEEWVATLVHAVEVVVNLAIYAKMWFEKVRGGSMHLNYHELVHKHLASHLKMYS